MLTVLKQIFVWWNQQTLGTRIYTFLNGKFVGKDEFGNKYFENKKKIKDGLFTLVKLMHQKYQTIGILGYILQRTKLNSRQT